MAHESEKKRYERDAQWHPRPWELWEFLSPYKPNWGTCVSDFLWLDDTKYRRKPDAPEKNCKMCKHRPGGIGFGVLCRHPGNVNNWRLWWVDLEKEAPEWCPLAQKEEEPDLLTAARDLLEWLEGFDLMRGADKVKALKAAINKGE